jgi:transposase
MEGLVTLNKKEQRRLMVLNHVEKGSMKSREAAVVLDLSLRQVRRLLSSYRRKGAEGLAHGNRGKKPANVVDSSIQERIMKLAASTYAGFNTQHLTEKLTESEGIGVSRSTVRRILINGGVSRPRKRRPRKHRSRRQRYQQQGMLVQMDGSYHDWLEGRGPWVTLLGAIDDATGKVFHALFRESEDTEGYFNLVKKIVADHGAPMAVYHDGHSVFEVSEHEPMTLEEQLHGDKGITQFGRLLDELNITSIRSRSPQARGRVERLWGTFQDRLVSELRLANAHSIEDANEVLRKYLPVHNKKFTVPPAEPGSAFHKPGPDWHQYFCLKYQRTVGMDNVVRFYGHRLQILPNGRYSYARAKVEVRQDFNGAISIYYQGYQLDTKIAPLEAPELRKTEVLKVLERNYAKPASDHPWRGVYRKHVDRG